jgi:hypothetical protein
MKNKNTHGCLKIDPKARFRIALRKTVQMTIGEFADADDIASLTFEKT